MACANAFDSLSWTLVSPQGGEYSVQSFAYMFADAPVSGEYSTTLSIGNVARDMNGWGAYCTFYYKGQTARTSTAYIYVSGEPTPAPTPVPVPDGGVYYGSVSSWNYSSVSVNLDGTTLVAIPWDVVSLNGEIYYGAPATVYWNGTTTKGLNITWCSIEGSQPQPMPVYGSMSGTAYDDSLGRICIFLQNGSTVYVSKSICNIYGQIYAAGGGSSCTVYYTDYPSEGNIYQVDVYGDDGYDDGGWAGANYYENEYFGYDDDYDDGGWAGSNYYDNEWGG